MYKPSVRICFTLKYKVHIPKRCENILREEEYRPPRATRADSFRNVYVNVLCDFAQNVFALQIYVDNRYPRKRLQGFVFMDYVL